MRIEDLLDGKIEVEVTSINISNRAGATGAKERSNIVYLRERYEDGGIGIGRSRGYIELNFEATTAELENYPPDTRFRVRLEKI